MGAFTSRAGLYKPGGGSTGLILPDETVDIDKLNGNFDKIDALLGARNIPSASSYSGNMDGDLVYAQDTKFLQMYSSADSKLITPKLPGSNAYKGTVAARDLFTDAEDGDHWVLTDGNKQVYSRRGTGWVREAPGEFGSRFQMNTGALAANAWTVFLNAANWTVQGDAMSSDPWVNGIKIPVAGMYRISASIRVGAAIPIILAIKLNNTGANSNLVVVAGNVTGFAFETNTSCEREIKLAAGDVLTLAAYTSGAAGPYGITPVGTSFAATLVRPD